MTSSYYHFYRSTNDVYKLSVHKITVFVTILQLKYSFFMIYKKGLLTELEKKQLQANFFSFSKQIIVLERDI